MSARGFRLLRHSFFPPCAKRDTQLCFCVSLMFSILSRGLVLSASFSCYYYIRFSSNFVHVFTHLIFFLVFHVTTISDFQVILSTFLLTLIFSLVFHATTISDFQVNLSTFLLIRKSPPHFGRLPVSLRLFAHCPSYRMAVVHEIFLALR